jgi:DNA-directed RNA polymerase alpha subunit
MFAVIMSIYTLQPMKRPEKFKVTDGAFGRLLSYLTIEECKEVIDLLQKRIEIMEKIEERHTKPVEELALSPRIINILKANNLFTLEDMMDFGIDRIKLLRGIGDHTLHEITRVYFEKRDDRDNNKSPQ